MSRLILTIDPCPNCQQRHEDLIFETWVESKGGHIGECPATHKPIILSPDMVMVGIKSRLSLVKDETLAYILKNSRMEWIKLIHGLTTKGLPISWQCCKNAVDFYADGLKDKDKIETNQFWSILRESIKLAEALESGKVERRRDGGYIHKWHVSVEQTEKEYGYKIMNAGPNAYIQRERPLIFEEVYPFGLPWEHKEANEEIS